jgi:PAS domain S-box-containing protein
MLSTGHTKMPSHLRNHMIAILFIEKSSGKIADVNNAASTLFEFTKADFLKHTFYQLTSSSEKEIKLDQLPKSKKLGLLHFKGRECSFKCTAFAYSINEYPNYMVMELHDSVRSKPKITTTCGLDNETKLKLLLDNSKDVIMLIDSTFKIITYNKMAQCYIADLFKKDLQEGDSILEYAEISTVESFKANFSKALAGQEIQHEIEIPFSNYIRWWSITYRLVLNSANQTLGVTFIASDIHERKTVEKSILGTKLFLQSVIDNLPNSVVYQFIVKESGDILGFPFVSSGAFELFGIEADAIMQDHSLAFKIVHPDDIPEMMMRLHQSQNDLSNYSFAYRITVKEQIKWVHTKSRAQKLADGTFLWNGLTTDITEQRKNSEKIAKSENHLRAVLNASTDFTYVIDTDLRITLFNKAAEISVEYYLKKKVSVGDNILDYAHIGNKELFLERLKKSFEGDITEAEFEMDTQARGIMWIFIRYTPVINDANEIVGVALNLTDITTRKLAEQSLKLAKSNLTSLVESTDTSYVLYNRDLTIVSFNSLAQMITQVHLGQPLREGAFGLNYLSEARKISFQQYFNDALLGKPTTYEVNYGSAEKPVWLEGRMFPVMDEEANVYAVTHTIIDITKNKVSQNEQMRDKKLYESLVKSQSSFLIRTDLEGRYSFVNNRFLEHFGFTLEDVIGKPSFDTVYHEDWPACTNAVVECIHTPGKIVKVMFRKPTKLGSFMWTEWEFVAIQNERLEITDIQCVGYDISDRLAAQNSFREASNRLSIATQAAGIGVWEMNMLTKALRWDTRMFQIFGVDSTLDLTLDVFKETVHADDLKIVEMAISDFSSFGKPVDIVFRIIRPNDQAIRFIQGLGMAALSTNNDSPHLVGVNFDITDRIEKEATIARALSEIEELQLRALRAAMNPHFIFNTLSTIQYFIVQNQRANAMSYLSKFSKLVRGILDSSSSKESTLASELELIKHYVEIEQLRFDCKFHFIVEIDPSIDIESTATPSLFLQPFIENAIVHGLYTKEGQGLLKLTIKENTDLLKVIIEDNGIGRTSALALRKKNFPEHQSRGLQFTDKRIELMNRHQLVESTIEDLMEDGKPAGTRVTIHFIKK